MTTERGARRLGYHHVEAFHLMLYRDTEGNEETIWNSRDGVTPFGVDSREGFESRHVEWERDVFAPTHVPAVGDRIWVTTTLEICTRFRVRYVEEWWDKKFAGRALCDMFESKEDAALELAKSDCERPGQPTLVVVTEEIAAIFAQIAAAPPRRVRKFA